MKVAKRGVNGETSESAENDLEMLSAVGKNSSIKGRVRAHGASATDTKGSERHQNRLLSNELRDLDAIKTRQEKNMSRDQREIKRDLWKLLEDRRRINFAKLQRAGNSEDRSESVSLSTAAVPPVGAARIRFKSSISVPIAAARFTSTTRKYKISQPEKGRRISLDNIQPLLLAKSHKKAVGMESSVMNRETTALLQTGMASEAKHMGTKSDRRSTEQPTPRQDHQIIDHIASVNKHNTAEDNMTSQKLKVRSKKVSTQTTPKPDTSVNKRFQHHQLETPETVREKTKNKLKQFLSEEGIDFTTEEDEDGEGGIPSLSKWTEDIIAMRNLGKTSDDIWRDVRSCRYLRGYDPPLMVISERDIRRFVFGQSTSDLYQQQIVRLAQRVEEAKQKAHVGLVEQKKLTSQSDSITELERVANQQYKIYMKPFL